MCVSVNSFNKKRVEGSCMIDVERKKEGGFVEYKHMLTKRASLIDCLDLMQAFYNLTMRTHIIYARGSEGETIKIDKIDNPVYDYECLANCSVFSMCGWYLDERCIIILTVELDKHRVFLYSEHDIDSIRVFDLIVHTATSIKERRNLLMSIANRDKNVLSEARWLGLDFGTTRLVLSSQNNNCFLPKLE